ncbi:MAG TPA: ParB/RepB/Spo0J family partition protein, partial [Pirellulaceae bacterium]
MNEPRRLGRGLAALLGGESLPPTTAAPAPGLRLHHPEATFEEVLSEDGGKAASELLLAVDEILENPFQPRRDFGEAEIASLAESLREHDMLQPVLVRRVGERWQLISGERRLRAAIRAGWKKIPARVRQADDRLVAELAIVENLQRKDLNPIEKALSFQRYLREHHCTQEDLGKRIKVDRSTIANLMRLLELPDSIQGAVRDGTVSAGHARALLPLGDAARQVEFCDRIRQEQLSVRTTEQLVQEWIQREDGLTPAAPSQAKRTRSSQHGALEQELRRLLGTKVDLRGGASGRGRLVIH